MKGQEDERGLKNYASSETKIDGFEVRKGRTRDFVVIGNGDLAIIATNRLAIRNRVLPDEVPFKRESLTQINEFWLSRFKPPLIPNHFKTTDVKQMPRHFQKLDPKNPA